MSESSFDEKQKIEQLEQQIAELRNLLISKTEKPKRQPREKLEKPKQEKLGLLSPNTYVKVMSLVNNPLNLGTRPHGKGKMFRFENFGDIKSLFYSELLEVIENHPNFFQAGYFFILDNRVIEENNWHETYAKILSKEQMESIYSNSDGAISLFKTSNAKQQSVIVDYFIDRIIMGKPVDRNLIADISEISGVDILERAKGSTDPDKKQ